MNLQCSRNRQAPFAPRHQRGVVLVISLIVLVALTLAGIALVRSTDTANVIAGNMAFRMGALQAVDTGVETAFTATTSDTGFFAAPSVATSTAEGQYFPIINECGSQPWVTRREKVGRCHR